MQKAVAAALVRHAFSCFYEHLLPPPIVARGAAAEAVAGRLLLGIRLGFHHHSPKPLAILLAFHQQAANQVGGDHLGRATEEGLGEGWEFLDGRGGYGSGCWSLQCADNRETALNQMAAGSANWNGDSR